MTNLFYRSVGGGFEGRCTDESEVCVCDGFNGLLSKPVLTITITWHMMDFYDSQDVPLHQELVNGSINRKGRKERVRENASHSFSFRFTAAFPLQHKSNTFFNLEILASVK